MLFDCEDDQELEQEQNEHMIKKKETIMLLSLKRRAALEAKKAMKESEMARKREEEAVKKELQEQRKLEFKQRREAILEQYRLKKKAAEAQERGNGQQNQLTSNRMVDKSRHGSHNNLSTTGATTTTSSSSSTTTSTTSSTNHRGTKSIARISSSQTSNNISSRNLYTGPKLFAKPTTKTNLILIQNAILKALEGAANAKTLKKIQDTISKNSKTCNHFLILFRMRGQFRGLYDYDDKQYTITKLDGSGPKAIHNEDILEYYKYDSPKRLFTEVQTKQISPTIIAFTIQDHLWFKS